MGKAGQYHHKYAGYYPPPDLNAEADEAFWKDRIRCTCDSCSAELWVEIVPLQAQETVLRYKYYRQRMGVIEITHCYVCRVELGEFMAWSDKALSIFPADLLPPIDTTEERIN